MHVYRHVRTELRVSFDSITLLCLVILCHESVLITCGTQEYGYITLYAINHPDYVNVKHMTTFPIQALLAAAKNQGGAYALETGNVSTWIYPYYLLFFFSSRRRHTRLTCDWSSDVCSSD